MALAGQVGDFVDWARADTKGFMKGPHIPGGVTYLEAAFRLASRALKMPPAVHAKLMYNDYAIHSGDTVKFRSVLRAASRLYAADCAHRRDVCL